MRVVILFSLLLSIAAQDEWPDCGWVDVSVQRKVDPSVVGGSDAIEGQIPWQLSLQYWNEALQEWRHTCGAVLIHNQWALTAAHCLYGRNVTFRVVAGEHNRAVASGNEQIVSLANFTLFPNYTSSDSPSNDIAVMALSQAVDLSSKFVGVACLPPSADRVYKDNPNSWISGWGRTNGTVGGIPDVLQIAPVDVISNTQCKETWADKIDQSHICLEDMDTSKISGCMGDSGGPLSSRVDALYEVAGITSWGSGVCDPKKPSVYTRVSIFLEWITAQTGVKPRPPPPALQ